MDLRKEMRKRAYDEQLETEVERYKTTGDFNKLFRMLKSYVNEKSKTYVKEYQARGLRVYFDDFAGPLWDAAMDLIEDDGYRKNTFRVVLNHRLNDRAKNVIRDLMTDKRKALTTASEFDEVLEETIPDKTVDVEETAINRVLIEQMSHDESLTDEEKRLFQLLRADPEASNQKLAEKMEYKHKEKIRRLKENLREKLARYYYY
ncbi:hypothetical protein [Aeribacillus pallidus]|uniref:hypothetical protein n=1 Tax=Aeribacillus pallidus TaxID=33936 RepID=UPI00105A420F|nr:hypothetical protein [Aeribacillus pallidus]